MAWELTRGPRYRETGARERDTAGFFAVDRRFGGLGFGSNGPSTRTLRGSKSGSPLR